MILKIVYYISEVESTAWLYKIVKSTKMSDKDNTIGNLEVNETLGDDVPVRRGIEPDDSIGTDRLIVEGMFTDENDCNDEDVEIEMTVDSDQELNEDTSEVEEIIDQPIGA